MNNPYIITEPTCISFSGGRTSAYMLYKILEANNGLPDCAKVCFANTGKEEEATLEFVKDCSVNWNVPITWLEYRPEKPNFIEVSFETASRNGEPFEALIIKKNYLPNAIQRFCTVEMKVKTIERYLKSVGWENWNSYLGIRADEPRRVAKINTTYNSENATFRYLPLAVDNVTEPIVWEFWDNQPFDLQLAKFSGASNCDLCFLKGGNIIAGLITQKPERALWWAKMESIVKNPDGKEYRFRKDRPSYSDMLKYNKDQMPMFNDETIGCFCGD